MNKTNLILFLGIVVLIIVILVNQNIQKNSGFIFNKSSIMKAEKLNIKISGKEIELVKNKELFTSEKLNEKSIEEIVGLIKNIKIIREIKDYGSLEEYGISKDIMSISVEKQNAVFGKKNPHNTGIYCFYNNKLYIVELSVFNQIRKLLL